MTGAGRALGLAAAILAAAIDALYVGIIVGQRAHSHAPGDPEVLRVVFVALYIAGLAFAAGASTLPHLARWRPFLLGMSAIGFLGIGVLAIFSIGLLLIAAGAVVFAALLVSLAPSAQPRGAALALGGALSAVLIIIGGFEIVERAVICPPTGFMSGAGNGLVTGPYHYTCVNGTLTLRQGKCTHGGAAFDASGRVIAVSDC